MERILKTLNFEEVDRPSIYDLPHNDAMIDYYGGGDVFKAIDSTLDMTRNIRFPQEERLVERDGFVIEQKRWTEWIKDRPFKNLCEFKNWVKNRVKKNRDYLKEDKGIQKEADDMIRVVLKDQKHLRKTHRTLTSPSVGLNKAYNLSGLELFVILYHEEPSLVSAWLETEKDLTMERIFYLKEPSRVSPIIFVGEDIAYKNGLIFSPKFLEKEFFPRLKEVIDAFHKKCLKVVFHSDGDLFPVLDDLVSCGIDGLNPLENMDIGKVRSEYPKLFLAGGLDCSHLLPFGTPREVRLAVEKAIKDGDRGYFLGSTSELHSDIPLENIRTMLETCWKKER